MKRIGMKTQKLFLFLKKNSSKVKVLLMKNLRLVHLKFGSFLKLAGRLALGAEKVTYTYILSFWFNKPKYKDMLEYIRTVPGCNYILMEE